ncbi:MAG: DEAD/DEAH box helicase [Muribaculaceae bacterium]|nr:DEAD/DEAH box helicase [Muribaculaceae bacterium]
MRFDELLTNDDLLDALYDMHFDECTPIQELAIPPVLEGRDLLAVAQTGTGKTAAYLLPVIERLVNDHYPQDHVNCVVMAPTRELAQQIDRQMQGFSYFMPVSSMAIYGGTDGHTYEQQRKGLKMGADVVIATPGRLLAHLSMGYVDLSKVSFFILDEADRMLDMGFIDDIMQIVGHMPKERQTLLFSATMPPKIQQLAKQILSDPKEVKIAVSKPAEKIHQAAYVCYETQKLPILERLFKDTPPRRVVIFSSSKLKVKELARSLKKMKFQVGEMHSDLDQNEREEVMLRFKSGRINVVVATDIISRGIDIDNIETVINYDVPHEAEDYVHRIGRTARADRDGSAFTFISEKERGKFKNIERLLEKEVEKLEVPEELGETPEYGDPDKGGKVKGRNGRKSRRRRGDKEKRADNNRHKPVATDANSKNQSRTENAQVTDKVCDEGHRHIQSRKRGHKKPKASKDSQPCEAGADDA